MDKLREREPTEPRLCGQCGEYHAIPESAECLRMKPEARQEAAMWAMKAELNCDWVRENYVPIKKIVEEAQGLAQCTRKQAGGEK